jgi:hypothetical protein
MKFPNPEQTSLIRKTKDILVKDLNSLMTIFGPYEKRLDNWFVSGGCIASILRGEQPHDYDIYFHTKETMDHVVSLITQSPDLMQHVADVDAKYRDVMGKDGKCITENAITMKNGLQFITKHYGKDTDIRDTFDFVHCMPVYSFYDRRLRISEEQFECCVNKILKVNCKENVTDKRIAKFKELGYTILERDKQVEDDGIAYIEDDDIEKLFGKK